MKKGQMILGEKKCDLLEEIETLKKIALANMDLATALKEEANAHEAKANLFLTELKVLRMDQLFLTCKVETLSKSLNESQAENENINKQVVALSCLDANKKIQ